MLNFSKTDISRHLAINAHRGMSFVPEKRADQVISGYLSDMQAIVDEFEKFATDENRDAIAADLERYKEGYLKRYNAVLAAKSRCMSAMITGPANFPTRRNQKRLDTERRRSDEFLAFCKKAREKMHKRYNPRYIDRAPISADDEDAITKLEDKIKSAEKRQEIMKAANKIVRKKKWTDEQKVAEMAKIDGISEGIARSLLEPDFAGRLGFPAYELSNNNANIRRMKQRVQKLERERNREPMADKEIKGVVVSENTAINRLQLFFPGKPSVEVRKLLKSRGFRWARSHKAWQRQLNDNARYAAKCILEQYEPDA